MDAFDAATEQDAFDALEQYARTCLQRFDDAPRRHCRSRGDGSRRRRRPSPLARAIGGYRGRPRARVTVQRRGPALPAHCYADAVDVTRAVSRPVKATRAACELDDARRAQNRGGRRGLDSLPSPAARAETPLESLAPLPRGRKERAEAPFPEAVKCKVADQGVLWRRRGGFRPCGARRGGQLSGSFPVITFPDCVFCRRRRFGLASLAPVGFQWLSLAFLLELTEIAHERGRSVWALTPAGAAVRVGRGIGNCYLLPLRWFCYLLPPSPSMFSMAISCFSARAHGARRTDLGSKNTVRAAFPTRQARCTASAGSPPAKHHTKLHRADCPWH